MALGSIYNIEVKPEHHFHLKEGGVIKSLSELIETLKRLDDNIYREHVNFDKNDFSNWIRGVFELDELAEKIKHSSRIDAIRILSEELTEKTEKDDNEDKIENMNKAIDNLHKTINELNERSGSVKEELLKETKKEEYTEVDEPPREDIDTALNRLNSLYKEKRETENPSKIVLHDKISNEQSIIHLDGSEYEEKLSGEKIEAVTPSSEPIYSPTKKDLDSPDDISIRNKLAKRIEELEDENKILKGKLREKIKRDSMMDISPSTPHITSDMENKEREMRILSNDLKAKEEELAKKEKEINEIREEYLENIKDFVRQKKKLLEKEREYLAKNNALVEREEAVRNKEFRLSERENDLKRKFDKYEKEVNELREEINKLI